MRSLRVVGSLGRGSVLLVSLLALPACFGPLALKPAGVVFEQVDEKSPLAQAGIRPGDTLISWERSSSSLGTEAGQIPTVFDWIWLKAEQAPRGPVSLRLWSTGRNRTVEVAPGKWQAKVRPQLPRALAEIYAKGHSRLRTGAVTEGIASLEQLLAAAKRKNDRALECWLQLDIGEAWFAAGNLEHAREAHEGAVRAAPGSLSRAISWHNLAVIYQAQGDLEKSEQAFRAALTTSGASSNSLWWRILDIVLKIDTPMGSDLAHQLQ